MHRCSINAALLIAAFSAYGPRRLLADEKAILDFKANYPVALARLKRAYSQVEATIRYAGERDQARSTQAPRNEAIYAIAINGDLKKLVQINYQIAPDGARSPQLETAMAFGKDYTFNLRKSTQTDNQFLITSVEKRGNPAAIPSQKETEFKIKAGKLIWCAYSNNVMNMDNIFNQSLFRVVSADGLIDRGRRVTRVRFTNASTNPTRLSGVAELLPDRSWAVRRLELVVSAPVNAPNLPMDATFNYEVASSVEYGEDRAGIPIPTQVVYEKNLKGQGTGVFNFEKVNLGTATPSSEFTLGYFGLPELAVTAPPPDPSRNNSVYWLIAIALIALIGAIVVLWKAKRTR